MIGTSAVPPIAGLTGPDPLGPADGVRTLHVMGDVHAVMNTLHRRDAATAVVVGAGCIGLEMAEALTVRGCAVTQIEGLPEVLPTLDPELGRLVRAELEAYGVDVRTATTVSSITRAPAPRPALVVRAERRRQQRHPRASTSCHALFNTMTGDGLNDLDLSYAPPLGSPWDPVQIAAQAGVRAAAGT